MKVGVVTRTLSLSTVAFGTNVSAVFKDPEDPEIDSLESYFQSKMDAHKAEFIDKLPEFKHAEWKLTIVELS
jgi:hypothetical protein